MTPSSDNPEHATTTPDSGNPPVAETMRIRDEDLGEATVPSALTGWPAPAMPIPQLASRVRDAVLAACGRTDTGDDAPPPALENRLVAEGALDEARLCEIYSRVSGIPALSEDELGVVERFPEVTYDFLNQYTCLPLRWDEDSAILAVADPYEPARLALLWESMFRGRPSFVLLRRAVVERYLTSLYDTARDGLDGAPGGASEEALRDLAREAPIVRLVNDVFSRALEMGASDIHVEPMEDLLAVRYRIDGVLQTVQTPPMSQYPAIASRLKLLAGMNIAERRLPQDGRIDLTVANVQIDVRVSTVPSMHGESIVLRLLRKEGAILDLTKVGMSDLMRRDFEGLFNMPHGMILVVGPTGSGKSTTLYCVMKILNSETRKIITVEDPVEYQLPGLTQIQVRPQIGLTFAKGLRSIVRQDPDVILVGEIRDRETAEIAIHAALTGHLVLSTLHTNDAAGAVSRLLEMGIESFLISSALLCVVSQRLVRRVCPECKGEGRIGGAGRRCRNCLGSGYRGRVGIFEMLRVNDDIRHAINEHKDSNEIAALARHHGMRPLREDGNEKVGKGITTAAEVTRVCRLDVQE